MPFNSEINELKRRYNILREQNEKLQGSIKVLQATNENLSVTISKVKNEKEKFKKAFEDIFISNIGNAWEKYSDKQKQEMSIESKISFFNREMNLGKLYIRQRMEERMEEIKETNKKLGKDLVQTKAKLAETEEKLSNASTIAEINPKGVKGNLLGNNEVLSEANTKIKEAEMKLKGEMKTIFQNNGIVESKVDNSVKKSIKEEKRTVPEKEKEEIPIEKGIQKGKKKEKIKKPSEEIKDGSGKKETVPIWYKFKKVDKKIQEQVNQKYQEIDKQLDGITFAKEILLTIGETGEYLHEAIFLHGVGKYWKDSNDSQVRTAIRKIIDLTESPLVQQDGKKIGQGRPKKVHLLSGLGEIWYALQTKSDPRKSLYIVSGKEQKSIEHGQLIATMVKVLQEAGYETAQEVSLPTTTTGEYSIADISARKGEFVNIRIECEMGNYSQQDYIFKFKKALEVSNRLLVGVPKKETKDKIEDSIKELIRESYKGIDEFKKAGKGYFVFSLAELRKNPDLILPQKKKYEEESR